MSSKAIADTTRRVETSKKVITDYTNIKDPYYCVEDMDIRWMWEVTFFALQKLIEEVKELKEEIVKLKRR